MINLLSCFQDLIPHTINKVMKAFEHNLGEKCVIYSVDEFIGWFSFIFIRIWFRRSPFAYEQSSRVVNGGSAQKGVFLFPDIVRRKSWPKFPWVFSSHLANHLVYFLSNNFPIVILLCISLLLLACRFYQSIRHFLLSASGSNHEIKNEKGSNGKYLNI